MAELFQGHPAVDDTIVYRHPGIHSGMGGKWLLARALRQGRYDLAVLLQNAFEAAFISALAGIPNRYGYATDGRGFLLTHPWQVPGIRERHEVEYYLALLRPLGLQLTATPPILYTTPEEDLAAAGELVSFGIVSGQPIIGLNPGSTYGTAKRWLPERYAEVADRLATDTARICLSLAAVAKKVARSRDLRKDDIIRYRPIRADHRATIDGADQAMSYFSHQ